MNWDHRLTDEEFLAVYDWVEAEKDRLPSPLKEGVLKLLNGEMHRAALSTDRGRRGVQTTPEDAGGASTTE